MKFKFPLYGALIGSIFAIFGGIIFGAIPAATIFGFINTDPGQFLVGFGFAGLYSVVFAILPGAVGGAYLARWLETSERTPRDVTFHSLLVGALAGLVAALAFIVLALRFLVDWMTAAFALLAIAVASVSSLLAAKFLAKKKAKFVKLPE
ncbi:MAG: hypothetical protein HY867_17825 [Chloroflexi bacterium]|nr:hypothetical protein [Chloroflexota bacterium]